MSTHRSNRWMAGLGLAGLALAGALASTAGAQQQSPATAGPVDLDQLAGPLAVLGGEQGDLFRRIASFPVFLNTSVDAVTVAEIVAATDDGALLIYTDSQSEVAGFVDISDPANPLPGGVVPLPGEPTSVAVRGQHALVCVNTSADFVNTSGSLEVIHIPTRTLVRSIPLGGQPDAIAVSPSRLYAAIAIENERDEDLGDGAPPQAPAGFVVIVDTVGDPAAWTTRNVSLIGVPDLFPTDPEPEFVDISVLDVAVVTLQENNHIVLIHLPTGQILIDFPAGAADLDLVDTEENDLIEQVDSLIGVAREPDAVTWTSPFTFATADEGDLFGGSRGFTTWNPFTGLPLSEAGHDVEHVVARVGHYPESRSENKGSEPEGVEFALYGDDQFLFVGSERSNSVLVYQLFSPAFAGNSMPVLRQVLPAGVGPEGLLAIPRRKLLVVACEEDARGDKFRSTIMLYKLDDEPNYPAILSADRDESGVPIPWAALSALAAGGDGDEAVTVHAVHDSYYDASRIYTLDVSDVPAVITAELPLVDAGGLLLAALQHLKASLPGTDDFDPESLVHDDGTVHLDLEGLAVDGEGDFWAASEGAGNLVGGSSDPEERPFERPNLLVHVGADGSIDDVVLLPLALTRDQLRFGFEGVAVTGDALYVCFQRAWGAAGDPSDRARIGRFDLGARTWGFAHYPLTVPASPNGGWVGLSELTHLGGDDFAVLERDDQGGTDAAIKHVTTFSVAGLGFLDETQVASFALLSKTLVVDLLAADAYGSTGGPVPEKLEGLAVLPDGTTLIVNDNDGVEDNSGETQLLRLPGLFD